MQLTAAALPRWMLDTSDGWLTARRGVELETLYLYAKQTPSDINEHVERFRQLGAECAHVTEFGVRRGVSTIAWIAARPKRLICYDTMRTADGDCLQDIARSAGVAFEYRIQDVLQTSIEETDLLFIDTEHTYDQLRQELELHADKARKYIVLHDTELNAQCGSVPGTRGLWSAVTEFLAARPEWAIQARYKNNNGLTVLVRSR